MDELRKEAMIEEIELDACAFGSLRLALKVFRKLTGAQAVERLLDLRSYLGRQSVDALRTLSAEFRNRLDAAGFPKAV